MYAEYVYSLGINTTNAQYRTALLFDRYNLPDNKFLKTYVSKRSPSFSALSEVIEFLAYHYNFNTGLPINNIFRNFVLNNGNTKSSGQYRISLVFDYFKYGCDDFYRILSYRHPTLVRALPVLQIFLALLYERNKENGNTTE